MQHGDPANSTAVFTNLPIYRGGALGISLFAGLSLMSLPAFSQTSRTLASVLLADVEQRLNLQAIVDLSTPF